MSVRLEHADGVGGGGLTVPPLALPQPCSPKDASSATVAAAPSFNTSRRVRLRMLPTPHPLDALPGRKVGMLANPFVLR